MEGRIGISSDVNAQGMFGLGYGAEGASSPMPGQSLSSGGVLSYTELLEYTRRVLEALGSRGERTNVAAESLVYADLRGSHTVGVGTLYNLLHMVRAERVDLQGEISVVYQSPATATLDGGRNMGAVCAERAMRLAIEKARALGVGWVSVRNSNGLGAASYVARMALEQGMVGVCMSNAAPVVAPVHSTARMLGANPLAVAVPAQRRPPLIFDFSTSPVTDRELYWLADEGQQVSHGLLQDALGCPTRDPATLQRGGAIRPLGGDLASGGHKGFCISALVDIFSALFGGAAFGPFVPSGMAFAPLRGEEVGRGVGHMIMAVRCDAFRPGDAFRRSVDQWIDSFKGARGVEASPGVILPGENERQLYEVRMKTGIPISQRVARVLRRVSRTLGVDEPQYRPQA